MYGGFEDVRNNLLQWGLQWVLELVELVGHYLAHKRSKYYHLLNVSNII